MKTSVAKGMLAIALVVGLPPLPGTVAAQTLEVKPFFYGPHKYCWFDSGWNGAGWYYCGVNWRRDYGWGGNAGWLGHRGPDKNARRGKSVVPQGGDVFHETGTTNGH